MVTIENFKKSRGAKKKSNKNFFAFRIGTSAAVLAICFSFGTFVKNSLAQTWAEPSATPPSGNVLPPIWNQNSSAQTGGLYVTGSGRFDAANYGNAYCLSTGSKVCGADSGAVWGVVGESNTGYGMYASSVSSYGIYASSASSYAGYFSGPVYFNGALSTTGTLSMSGSTSGLVTLKPAAAAGTWTLTLPTTAGTSGQYLQTNGAGVTTWATVAAGGSQTPWTSNINAAGFTLQGNSTASGNLTLDSTSSATKGYVLLNPTGGNVGIGNSAPTALLSLGTAGTRIGTLSLAGNTSGTVTITPAAAAGTWTLTLPTTAGTSGQYLQTNGSGGTTWATVSSSGITGSGTANYVPLFTSSSALGNSAIYQSGSNIGIGITNPGVPLVAYSTASVMTNDPGNSQIRAQASATRWLSLGYDSTNNVGYIQAAESAVAWRNLILEYNGGNVGIGLASPAQKLDVNGYVRATSGFCISSSCITSWPSGGGMSGSGTTNYIPRFTAGTTLGNSSIYDTGTYVGIGTTSNTTYKLRVNGGTRLTAVTENQALFVDSPYVGILVAADGTTITAVPTQGAIYALSDASTYAINGDNSSTGAGVYGSSYNGYGLSGYSTNSYGVYGHGSYYGFYTPDSSYVGGSMSIGSGLSAGGSISASGFSTSGLYYQSGSPTGGQFVGNWSSSDWWGIGPNNGGSDRTIRIGATTSAGVWNGAALNLQVYGFASFVYNTQSWPATGYDGGLTVGWNHSGGGAEVDFFNRYPGAGTGFNFYTANGTNSYYLSASIAYSGAYATSDRRLKTSIKSLDENYGLSLIEKLNPVSFKWKYDPANVGEQLGLIAQEVKDVIPQAVKGNDGDKDPMTINYSEITPVLIKAVQEQQVKIKEQDKHIDELMKKIDSLEKVR